MKTKTDSYSRILRLGTIRIDGLPRGVWIKVETGDGAARFTGVEGPKSNGDAAGSCGQIIIGFKEYDHRGYKTLNDITPGEGWTREEIKRLFDLWDRWHMNDTRAGCEHQRAEHWGEAQITITKYELDWDHHRQLVRQAEADWKHQVGKPHQHRLERLSDEEAETRGKQFREIELADDLQALKTAAKFSQPAALLLALRELGLRPFTKVAVDPAELAKRERRVNQFGEFMAQGVKVHTETRHAGHVYATEHPEGVLCKPCPVCGYEYGSKWLREELPEDFRAQIESFPEAKGSPAWI